MQKSLQNIAMCSSVFKPLVHNLIEAFEDWLQCYMQQEAFCWSHERENVDRHIQTCFDDAKYDHIKTCSADTQNSMC